MSFLRHRLLDLRSGFLFVPGLVVVALFALAVGLVEIDRLTGAHGVGVAFGANATAARTVLSTIAGAVMTVAGVSYSITIVTLQLVSQQFSPRALRGFLSDRVSQVAIGSLIGVFAYCVTVLRAIRNAHGTSPGFVPSLSVGIAVVLALVALALLLVFLHHMSTSIQVESITARTAAATAKRLDALYPDAYAEAVAAPPRPAAQPLEVRPERAGYVQSVDVSALAGLLGDGDRVHVVTIPGDFVTTATVVAEIWSDRTEQLLPRVRRTVVVSDQRDLEQDVGYGLQQLADIAVKALSPGVNDPGTALTAIGYLRDLLERLAPRSFAPTSSRADDGGRLLVRGRTFDEYIATMRVVAHAARPDPFVTAALCAALRSAAAAATRAGAERRAAALRSAAADAAAASLALDPPAAERRLLEEAA